MSYAEEPVVFGCDGADLVGILAVPKAPRTSTGVLVIVGGPQYRAGSHRQFVLLSRELAAAGIPCMRFDYRGMGDSLGAPRNFEHVDDDVRAALDTFLERVATIERVVLWGLCDGASAACFYAQSDTRVSGLVLLNPWVRTEAGEAKTYLKHYYLKRLFSAAFWRKLFARQVSVGRSVRELGRAVQLSSAADAASGDLPTRMAASLSAARLPTLFILSGNDYVANEFDEVAKTSEPWTSLRSGARVERLAAADHTFSSAEWRAAVARLTTEWVLEQPGGRPDA